MAEEGSSFAALLRNYRRRAGMTQAQLAELAYCSASLLSRYERGARLPSHPGVLESLVRALALETEEARELAGAAGLLPALDLDRDSVASLVENVKGIQETLQNLVTLEEEREGDPYIEGWRELYKEWRYFDHESEEGVAKKAIADWLVKNPIARIGPRGKLALDSGTTTATVAKSLIEQKVALSEIFTNNTLVVPILAGRYRVFIAGGEFKDPSTWNSFGATLGPWAERAAEEFPADLVVIGATSLSFRTGPCAATSEDRSFKRALIESALARHAEVVVAIDYRKLIHGMKAGDFQLFEAEEWQQRREGVVILTAGTPPGREDLERLERVEREIGDALQRADYASSSILAG